ncbi:hypothetical protein DRO24_02095 [Candidatus Bathyarchaeota archaeon]|nr:MAG: hypothetical protein DRO24_02095 [Candidatus Bathyarchaeota archaeon]
MSLSVVSLGGVAEDVYLYIRGGFTLGSSRIAVRHLIGFGGSAANTAVALSRLGVSVGFLGAVGDDELGHRLLNNLRGEGVDISAVQVLRGRRSTRIYVIVDVESGERGMIGVRDASLGFKPDGETVEYVAGAEILHVSGYMLHGEPLRGRTRWLMEEASRRGVRLSLDLTPESADKRLLRGLDIDILLCNEDEMRRLGYQPSPEGALKAERELGCRGVIVKLGQRGCASSLLGETHHKPAFKVEVVDTTGAGDAFNAGILYGILKGLETDRMLELANALGAYACMAPGARHLPGLEELEAMLGWRP